MSFSFPKANTVAEEPKLAGLEEDSYSSSQENIPVPWSAGPYPYALKWITPVVSYKHVPVSEKVGKEKQVVGHEVYCDIAGIACLGLGDRVKEIKVNNQSVWSSSKSWSDTGGHPDYYRVTINTNHGTFYIYRGRDDQPIDDILIYPYAHKKFNFDPPDFSGGIPGGYTPPSSDVQASAYRGQVLVVCKDLYCGRDSEAVPTVQVEIERAPRPAVGTFTPQLHTQGESAIAAILELLTHKRAGIGLTADYFDASVWEAQSAAVMSLIGRIAPYYLKQESVTGFLGKILSYFDGYLRWNNGKIEPGFFPHDGVVPAPITELSHHDYVDPPKCSPEDWDSTFNDVTVSYRDRSEQFKKKPVQRSSAFNRRITKVIKNKTFEMLFFLDRVQAGRWAQETVSAAALPDNPGMIKPKPYKAVQPGGDKLLPGDNFQLDDIDYSLDQLARITSRTDSFDRSVELNYVNEHGAYPVPYQAPDDLAPKLNPSKILPEEITDVRIFELPGGLQNNLTVIEVAFLAKRPYAYFVDQTDIKTNQVRGFYIHHSADQATYDNIAVQNTWAVRGVLREAITQGASDPLVKVTLDTDNLDLQLVGSPSSQDKIDDILLLFIGSEVFTIGDVTVNGYEYDFEAFRARRNSAAAAHALNDEIWIIPRKSLKNITHANFVENATRYFKLQPYAATVQLPLEDADSITYQFADRAAMAPVITLTDKPSSGVVGKVYSVAGTITDINGDLRNYVILMAKMSGSSIETEIVLQSADFPPTGKATHNFNTRAVFPLAGTWKIVVRAWDDRLQEGYKELQSADITVTLGSGSYGDDPTDPPADLTGVSLTGAFEAVWGEWANTPEGGYVNIYEHTTASKPQYPVLRVYDNFFSRSIPGNGTTRYYWFEPVSRGGVAGTVNGPNQGTTIDGLGNGNLTNGNTLVEIVAALPTQNNFEGRTCFLTTNGKLYRYKSSSWTAAVPTGDLTGQILAAQIAADAIESGHLSSGSVTADAVGTNEIIAVTANIKDGVISNAKIINLAVTEGKIANLAVTEGKIANLAVTNGKIANLAVTEGKIANLAVTNGKIDDLAVSTLKIQDNAVTVPASAAADNIYVSSSSTWIDLVQLTVSCTGAPAVITCSAQIKKANNYNIVWTKFQLLRGTTAVHETEFTIVEEVYQSTQGPSQLVSFQILDTPGSGSATYKLQAKASYPNYAYDVVITFLEVKK